MLPTVMSVAAKRYPALIQAEVTFSILLCENEDETKPSVKLHGVACAATIKPSSLEQRARGIADVLLKIDSRHWHHATDRQREALIAHELRHLDVVMNEEEEAATDDQGRPKIKTIPHDWDLAGFIDIAQDYGSDAVEIQQIQAFATEPGGQFVMRFVDSKEVKLIGVNTDTGEAAEPEQVNAAPRKAKVVHIRVGEIVQEQDNQ